MIQKIAVVGNAGAGKTTLSKRLAEIYKLPLIHVDTIQFNENMQLRPSISTLATLTEIQGKDSWIMDGYGPLDIIEKRFTLADVIVFIDLPLWQHYWWSAKRQLKGLVKGEINLPYTYKLFRTIIKVHRGMRPELLKIFAREQLKNKMVFINNRQEWQRVFQSGFDRK